MMIRSLFSMLFATGLVLSVQLAAQWTVGTVSISPGPWGPALGGGTPPNDNCADAVVVDLQPGVPATREGDNTGATNEFGYGNSVYEAFTITECMDVTVSYCGTVPAFGGAFTFLFRNCPLDNLVFIEDIYISSTACGDGNFTLTFPQLPPGTYYYGVLQYEEATGPYTITFSGTACTATPPVNDECPGAITLVPSPECNPFPANAFGATVSGGSLPPITCTNIPGDAADDIWFQFTATATDHTVIVTPSSRYYAVVEVRTGTCSASTTLACVDLAPEDWQAEQQVNATGLTIGETYYIRVYDWYAGLPATTTFDICVLGPSVLDCDADAGTLTPTNSEVCLVDGVATISATPNGDAVVPVGFEQVYVQTNGPGLVIENLAAQPSFSLSATGSYTIHTLVYDPVTLDLSLVVPGVTTGIDVNALLVQGGGDICGSLDVAGAAVQVVECCTAEAGTLTAVLDEVELVDGSATLGATPNGDAVVPAGFEVVHVLTEGVGLVIMDVGAAPEFTVSSAGSYTIHTLVYDPATLDLSIVEIGVTTGFDVNALLIQGGGEICGALDVAGAPVQVVLGNAVGEHDMDVPWTVFPNPGNGDVTIVHRGVAGPVLLEVLDMTGRVLYEGVHVMMPDQPVHLALAGRMARGSYIMRIHNDGGVSERRFVVR